LNTKFILCLSLALIHLRSIAQITLIGHNLINGEKLKNTQITVKDGNSTVQSFNTKASSEFRVKLDFGKIYQIYFSNKVSPIMHMEVVANNIPADKRSFHMVHEVNVPFYYSNDEDIDTLVFGRPFYKIIFNGGSKMVDDTTYNNAFEKTILKPINSFSEKEGSKDIELPIIIAGRALINGDTKLPLVQRNIFLLNKNGKKTRSTITNRFGAFTFTQLKASEVSKLVFETDANEPLEGQIAIVNSKGKAVSTTTCKENICPYELSNEQIKLLTDNNYNSNLGGKFISTTRNEKKFFSRKTIYLSNKRNTVVAKTTTNIFGSFVFENIRPDDSYFIGIEQSELGPGERIDFLNKDDKFIASLDTITGTRKSIKIHTDFNARFNDISISEAEIKMDVKAKIYGDNISNPIGKLKILLLNDTYQVIDSALTDDFGTFRFKYLPFLKRFYLSAENSNNILDIFNNILVYSSEDNLIKIMTHSKGQKFNYKPLASELTKLKEVEIDDPWLILTDTRATDLSKRKNTNTIIENILFDNNKYDLLPTAKQILDKVILVLNTNKKIKLELSAHTDSKGNDADNLKLSEMRAKAVSDYITAAGIDAQRIQSHGHGENKPLNKCRNGVPCSEPEHAQNRRVEFKIIED
jgi:outer membrane protein OmpA-like peptidoglycan-associated protein